MSAIKSYIQHGLKQYVDALNPDVDNINSNLPMPLIITQPNIYNPKQDTPFMSFNPLKPNLITSGFYKDLNKDKSVQKTFSKYYYYKIIDKWIYKELLPLLAFIDTSSEKPQLIKSLEFFDVQKLASNTEEEIEKKVKYMENILLTKDLVRHVLKKICNDNNINWYDLNKHEKKIKKVFYNYLLDKLKDTISKFGNK
jgi:hypothetical protein